jgi:hypothetical protein
LKGLASLLIFFVLASGARAEDAPYRCKDFVSDNQAFAADKSITWKEMGTNFSQAAGIVVGVYFAKSGEAYDYGSQGFHDFQDAVFADCQRHPDDKVAIAALRTPVRARKGSAFKAVSLVDLRLDFDKMKGQRIEVTGTLQTMGEISMISSGVLDMNKMFVETKGLPRESRKYLLENCDSGCEVTVRGKAADVMLNPGIVAQELVHE